MTRPSVPSVPSVPSRPSPAVVDKRGKFHCPRCGRYAAPSRAACPHCGRDLQDRRQPSLFSG